LIEQLMEMEEIKKIVSSETERLKEATAFTQGKKEGKSIAEHLGKELCSDNDIEEITLKLIASAKENPLKIATAILEYCNSSDAHQQQCGKFVGIIQQMAESGQKKAESLKGKIKEEDIEAILKNMEIFKAFVS